MKDMAIAKLKKEAAELKNGGSKVDVMKGPVSEALQEFCRQDGEFAQAVLQGHSFAECMQAVSRGVGGSISDLEAYRRAVQFYFPGADIRFRMEINLCAGVEQPEDAAPVVLDLFDLL